MTTPYCTTIDIAQGIRLDLLTPTAFRFRVSTLAGEPFPPKYEIPFALGRTRSWPEVPYQRRTDAFDLIETASLQIQIARDLSQGKKFLVHTPDGSRRIYPSDGSPRSSGMFRDGYTVFDSASALSEENNNSRYAHWFHNPESGRYDVFLPEDAILDTFFVYGPRYDQLFASINEIIGPEPLLPIAAYGFFQTQHLLCAGSQEKLLALAKRLREQHIPCDTLILDIEWGDGCDGESPVPLGHRLAWSPRYCSPLPPERMIEELKKRHFSVMLNHHSVPGFRDRNDRGWTGKVWDQSEWWREFHAKLDYGLGGPWMDTRQNDITDSIVWDGIQEHIGDRRVLFMGCRDMWETSGCAGTFKLVPSDQLIGSRRYPFDWTGDCAHTWEELRWQIRAITDTHGSMKAVTYITNDALAENHRLQARWNQFLSFNTIVRSHSQKPWQNCDPFTPGSNPESEPPGETAEESIRAHLELRYRLLPYLYSHAHQNYRTGLPICRPMLLAFPMILNATPISGRSSTCSASPSWQPRYMPRWKASTSICRPDRGGSDTGIARSTKAGASSASTPATRTGSPSSSARARSSRCRSPESGSSPPPVGTR